MALPNPFSDYSDASSTYWPPGWNFTRLIYATPEDDDSLSDEERAKMQAGLREVLGEGGVGELAKIMRKEDSRIKTEEQKRTGIAVDSPPPAEPQWLKESRKHYRDQPWGFVAFYLSPPTPPPTVGTASGDNDASTHQQQRKKPQDTVWEMTKEPFDTAVDDGHLEVNEGRSGFEIKWVEVAASAGDDDITILRHLQTQYREMREKEIPLGLAQDIFLVANASSVRSMSAGATLIGKYWRQDAPFLLAVVAEAELNPPKDDDVERGETVFKVAVESLVEELWPAVHHQTMDMITLTHFVRGARLSEDGEEERQPDDDLDDIWWSASVPPRFTMKRMKMRGFTIE